MESTTAELSCPTRTDGAWESIWGGQRSQPATTVEKVTTYWAGTASGRNSEGEAQADRRQLELEVRRAKPRSDFELVRSAKAFL